MKLRNIIFALVALLMVSSCAAPKKISYFQDVKSDTDLPQIVAQYKIVIKPYDKISILVNSKDPMLTNLFNLPIVNKQLGQMSSMNYGNSYGLAGYTVDIDGNIDFPVLGVVHVGGMSRDEIAQHIKNELISRNLVNDPVVTVEYLNLSVSVLGEVNRPGKYNIEREKITIFDAISMAGDLTIHGLRDNVMVLRDLDGVQKAYRIDLCSSESVMTSPVYYLQQNDIVYVEPNSMKARQSTVNGNTLRSSTFWMSLASLLTTIIVVIVK